MIKLENLFDLNKIRKEKEYNSVKNTRQRKIVDWLEKLAIPDKMMVYEMLMHIEEEIREAGEKAKKKLEEINKKT